MVGDRKSSNLLACSKCNHEFYPIYSYGYILKPNPIECPNCKQLIRFSEYKDVTEFIIKASVISSALMLFILLLLIIAWAPDVFGYYNWIVHSIEICFFSLIVAFSFIYIAIKGPLGYFIFNKAILKYNEGVTDKNVDRELLK